jgi:pimeloyl-ACP methyl ester carboxylesterase
MESKMNRNQMVGKMAMMAVCIVTLSVLSCAGHQPAGNQIDGVISSKNITFGDGDIIYPNAEGFATAETTGIRHWYQRSGPPDARAVVLINGSDAPTSIWHVDLVEALLGGGFQVVRYDPRDCGRSERLPWPKGFNARSWTPASPPPYPLDAMTEDLVGLLDALDVDEAHFVGVSMGGMIAQLMAISYPDRVLSLSLLSTSPSNSFDPAVAAVDQERLDSIIELMEKAGMDAAFSFVLGDRWIGSLADAMQMVTDASDGGADNELLIRETEEIGGYNFRSSHGFAIAAAPSRVPELTRISAPTLILHGTADPWFSLAHAKTLEEGIAGARLITVEGEGHASPRNMYNRYAGVIVDHLIDADARAASGK